MPNKILMNAKTDFEKRDLAVQFGCWLCINYYYDYDANQYCLDIDEGNLNAPRTGFAEDLFNYWIEL